MDAIGLISATIAGIAAFVAYYALNEQRRITKWSTNYTRLADTEALANNCHSILELHGITQSDIERCDAKAEEIVYLLQSFRAGQEWSRLSRKRNHSLSPYRKQMLNQPKVACIWKDILRNRIIFDSPFVQAVDRYLKENVESSNNANAGESKL